MNLKEALEHSKEGGYSIRNGDHGLQALAPDGENFFLTGTLNGPYQFTRIDHIREDWEVVGLQGLTSQNFAPNFAIESQFGPEGETPIIYQPEPEAEVKVDETATKKKAK